MISSYLSPRSGVSWKHTCSAEHTSAHHEHARDCFQLVRAGEHKLLDLDLDLECSIPVKSEDSSANEFKNVKRITFLKCYIIDSEHFSKIIWKEVD